MTDPASAPNQGVTPGDDPSTVTTRGTLERGADPAVRAFTPPDPARFARALFIRELERAGVDVNADVAGPNRLGGLPEPGAYPEDAEVASVQSPELQVLARMILSTSYNDGANTTLCLLAVEAGSTDCTDGLQSVDDLIKEAGIPLDQTVLIDGQGGDPASATPEAINAWLQWSTERDWGPALENGLPILGETGVLALSGTDSPAKGRVKMKTGTSIHPIPPQGRFYSLSEGLAGFLDTEDGKKIATVYVNGGVFPDQSGFFEVGDDVAAVAAALQQDPD